MYSNNISCHDCTDYMRSLSHRRRRGTGLLNLAFGSGYVEMAIYQVALLKAAGNVHPVSIIVDASSFKYATSANVFDNVVLYRPECFNDGLNDMTDTPHIRYNMVPELRFELLTPYDEFIKIDVDIVPQPIPQQQNVSRGLEHIWSLFRRHGQAFATIGRPHKRSRHWHWGQLGNISDRLQKQGKIQAPMCSTHAGVIYVNYAFARDDALRRHFDAMREGLSTYRDLHFLPLYNGGPVDEILISYAFASANPTWTPINYGVDVYGSKNLPIDMALIPGCKMNTADTPIILLHVFSQYCWENIVSSMLKRVVKIKINVKSHAQMSRHTKSSIRPFTCNNTIRDAKIQQIQT